MTSHVISDFTQHEEVAAWSFLAVVTFFLLLRVDAPYGKFSQRRWWTVAAVDGKWGWFVQEMVSPWSLLYFYYTFVLDTNEFTDPAVWYLLSLWLAHYLHRACIYTWMVPSMHETHLTVVCLAMVFNLVNGYLNAKALSQASSIEHGWNLAFGSLVFFSGMFINIHSDYRLMALRTRSSSKNKLKKIYVIPEGGWFDLVSTPNYFGEILEWTGFAVMAQTSAAWSFVLWTACNLIPRALRTHHWYHKRFGKKYPHQRKAIIPWCL